jgi:ATP-binding cassette, subfamily B, bacterial IrtA/YbtP
MSKQEFLGQREAFWRLLEIAGAGKVKLFFSILFSILGATFALAPFVVIYYISGELLKEEFDTSYIFTLVIIALAAIALKVIFQYVSVVLSHVAAYDILYGLRKKLTSSLAELPMGYFSNSSSGEVKKIINEDVEEIELFIGHYIPDISTAITLPLLTIGFLFFKDWRMALAALVPVVLAFVVQKGVYADHGGLVYRYHRAMAKMHATIIEYVRGMPVIKVFNQTVSSFARFQNSVKVHENLCVAWVQRTTRYYSIYLVLINSALFFILPLGVWLYLNDSLSMHILFLFLLLGIGYAAPLVRISNYFDMMALIQEGVRRIDGILNEKKLEESSTPTRPKKYDIEFNDVSFGYEPSIDVLNNISFKIKENSMTALVGPSGAGKTTIAQLIPRFWDVNKGEINIGGVNIKDIPVEDLMDIVSSVFQDVFMLNDTIYNNIKMESDLSMDEVSKAAKLAQVHDFIASLPDGYETVIGAQGVHLSGGEQQRISIARTMLKNSPIVILDEATAFADPENESKIQRAFRALMDQKTVIVIAHRLSTIVHADQILVVDDGGIQECGTHEELLKRGGVYKNMWDAHICAKDWKFSKQATQIVEDSYE